MITKFTILAYLLGVASPVALLKLLLGVGKEQHKQEGCFLTFILLGLSFAIVIVMMLDIEPVF